MAHGRMRRWFAGWGTAMYTGALFLIVVGRVSDPSAGAKALLALALLGALYGLGVLGLMRVFGVQRWGLAVAGLLAGPVPAVVFLTAQTPAEDRGGLLVLGALLGLFLGLLEWNRTTRRSEERADS